MKRDLKAFIWSSGLHAMIFISLFVLNQRIMTYSKPILIDFSIEESVDAINNKEEIKSAVAPVMRERVKEEARSVKSEQTVKESKEREETMPKSIHESTLGSPVVEGPSEEQVPIPLTPTAVSRAPASKGKEIDGSSMEGTIANSRPGNAVSKGSRGDSLEKARQGYLKDHFAYIRDIITKNISYPYMARKMGWSGRVTVSFVIIEDGSVRDIRVVESSGFELLDRNAVEAVKKASPFPRPPVSAEIIVPVVYRLN